MLEWTWRTAGRIVLTRWRVVQGPRRCAFSHISAGKAPQYLRCTGVWHQGWSTESHPQALGSVPSHISAGKALRCTGSWHEGWSTESHPQALSHSLVFQAGAPALFFFTIPGRAGNGCVQALILVSAASASRVPHSGGSCHPFARRHVPTALSRAQCSDCNSPLAVRRSLLAYCTRR